jgi:hypothetical protein
VPRSSRISTKIFEDLYEFVPPAGPYGGPGCQSVIA